MPQVPRERAWMSGSGRGAPSAWPSWARAPANAAAQSNGTPRSLASALTNGCDRAFLIGACALVAGVALAQLLPSGGRAAAGIGAARYGPGRAGGRPQGRRGGLGSVGGLSAVELAWRSVTAEPKLGALSVVVSTQGVDGGGGRIGSVYNQGRKW